jgi:hypothetical protein
VRFWKLKWKLVAAVVCACSLAAAIVGGASRHVVESATPDWAALSDAFHQSGEQVSFLSGAAPISASQAIQDAQFLLHGPLYQGAAVHAYYIELDPIPGSGYSIPGVDGRALWDVAATGLNFSARGANVNRVDILIDPVTGKWVRILFHGTGHPDTVPVGEATGAATSIKP